MPHPNVTHELVDAMNERPEILKVIQTGDLRVRVVKGDWNCRVGYLGDELSSDTYLMDLYREACATGSHRPPLIVWSMHGGQVSKKFVQIRQQIAMLPLTALLDRCRVLRADEEPWQAY